MSSKKALIRRLRKGKTARAKFVESHLNKKLAFQIRSLRGDLSQEEMEQRVGIKQQAFSRLENPYYGKATLTTLKKIAAGCDVGLIVEFVPFSKLVNQVSGIAYIEHGFSPETMNVLSFEEEEQKSAFNDAVFDDWRVIRPLTENKSKVISIDAFRSGKELGTEASFKPEANLTSDKGTLPKEIFATCLPQMEAGRQRGLKYAGE